MWISHCLRLDFFWGRGFILLNISELCSGTPWSYLETVWSFWGLRLNSDGRSRAAFHIGLTWPANEAMPFWALNTTLSVLEGFSIQAVGNVDYFQPCVNASNCSFQVFLFLSPGSFLTHVCWSVFSSRLKRKALRNSRTLCLSLGSFPTLQILAALANLNS